MKSNVLFTTKTLLGQSFICTKCRETKSGPDVVYSRKKSDYLCKLCNKSVIAISVYREDIEGIEQSNDSTKKE